MGGAGGNARGRANGVGGAGENGCGRANGGHVTSGIIEIFDATASDEDDAVSMVVFADGLRVSTAAMGSSM